MNPLHQGLLLYVSICFGKRAVSHGHSAWRAEDLLSDSQRNPPTVRSLCAQEAHPRLLPQALFLLCWTFLEAAVVRLVGEVTGVMFHVSDTRHLDVRSSALIYHEFLITSC